MPCSYSNHKQEFVTEMVDKEKFSHYHKEITPIQHDIVA
jgi:hypothetical protein